MPTTKTIHATHNTQRPRRTCQDVGQFLGAENAAVVARRPRLCQLPMCFTQAGLWHSVTAALRRCCQPLCYRCLRRQLPPAHHAVEREREAGGSGRSCQTQANCVLPGAASRQLPACQNLGQILAAAANHNPMPSLAPTTLVSPLSPLLHTLLPLRRRHLRRLLPRLLVLRTRDA